MEPKVVPVAARKRLSRLACPMLRRFAAVTLALASAIGELSLADETAELDMAAEFRGFNFGKEHGLPDNDVRDILQTRDGYLWILTQEGLARFDGTGFTVFDRSNNPEFQSDDPRALAEDAQGRLWVGGKNLLLRMSLNSLQRVELEANEKPVHAYCLCPAPNGGMWVGSQNTVALVEDGGVRIFGPESGLESGGMVRALQVDRGVKKGRLIVSKKGRLIVSCYFLPRRCQ